MNKPLKDLAVFLVLNVEAEIQILQSIYCCLAKLPKRPKKLPNAELGN